MRNVRLNQAGILPFLRAAFLSLTLCDGTASANTTPIETIHIIPMSHLDIGFNDTPREVARKYAAAVEESIRHAKADPAYVWNIETFWQLRQWLDGSPEPEQVDAFVKLVQAGRIGVGGSFLSPHPFVMSQWSLEHLCVPAIEWGRQHGVTIDWACLNDVPGYPADLPAALSRQGIRYLLLGVNQSLTPVLPKHLVDTPFWWAAPTGERVLTFIAEHGYTAAYMRMGVDPQTARFFARKRFGDLDPMATMEKGIGERLADLAAAEYPFDAFLTIHAFDNWGSKPAQRLPEAVATWNQAHGTEVKLRISTPAAFFTHIDNRYGRDLPVRRGGFGGEWDLMRLSIPTYMRRLRTEEARLAALDNAGLSNVQNLLIGYGHSNGLGPGWPNLLTRAQTIEHNRWWANIAAGYADAKPTRSPSSVPTTLPLRPDDTLQTNGLYAGQMILFSPGLGDPPSLLSSETWTALPPLRLTDGTLRLRHRIDRRKLPEPATVVWAWKIPPADLDDDPQVETASGWVTLPRDDLRSDRPPKQWISPRRTRLGKTTVGSNTILLLRRDPERYPGWLLALCLRQSLEGRFKGDEKEPLTFEQAYPGEQPICELTFDVREAP